VNVHPDFKSSELTCPRYDPACELKSNIVGGSKTPGWSNTGLDNNEAVTIDAAVVSLQEKIHRRKRNKMSKSYHLEIDQNQSQYQLKKNWKISYDQFKSIGTNKYVIFSVKPGFLKQPWIQSIEPTEEFLSNWK
jgi:hypothetical protein